MLGTTTVKNAVKDARNTINSAVTLAFTALAVALLALFAVLAGKAK